MIYAAKPCMRVHHGLGRILLSILLTITYAAAQASDAPSTADPASADPAVTMFPHSQTARWWVSGQDNIISQWHPSFRSQYSGPNSFRSEAEHAVSNVATLFTGLQLSHTTEIFMHFEAAAGGGLSDALGLAGFTDLDVVRNPTLGTTPYIARGMIRQIIPLSDEMVESERTPWYLATEVPVRRIELRFGKMGVNDFFDTNDVGTDSHSQFMNWTVDNNGAFDYAADTRGYTVGLLAEFHDRSWAFRFEEALMPKVANGIDLEWNLRQARAENYELELHPRLSDTRDTTIRLLSFVNHANMGVYRDAINNYLAGKTPTPEITDHPLQTTVKYGFERERTTGDREFASPLQPLRLERRAARVVRLHRGRSDDSDRRGSHGRSVEKETGQDRWGNCVECNQGATISVT